MIGFGILEIAFFLWGSLYILNSHERNENVEYVQLNREQFNNLKQSLIINNVIPEEMLLRDRIELQSSQIPPSYDEVLPSNNRNVAVNSKNTHVSENSVRETEIFDEDALERVM